MLAYYAGDKKLDFNQELVLESGTLRSNPAVGAADWPPLGGHRRPNCFAIIGLQ